MLLDEQQFVRGLLSEHFTMSVEKNSRYSMRAFAERLGISSSALSEILRGKRNVSKSKALELATRLEVAPEVLQQIEKVFSGSNLSELSKLQNPYKEIVVNEEQYDLFSNWLYFGLIALMRTKPFYSDIEWMAQRLSVSPKDIEEVLQRLKKMGIIEVMSNGEFRENKCSFRTSEGFPKEILRTRKLEGLKAAQQAIAAEREWEFSAHSVISADPKKFPEAQKMTEEFLKKLSFFLHEGQPSEVFELHIQLFPRTS